MSVKEGTVSLTDENVEVQQTRDFSNTKTRNFRPETNKTYRIKFTSGDVMLRRRHYNPTTKRYYRCLDYQGYCPVCVAASNKVGKIKGASDTFGANILVYDTDAAGTLASPLNAEVHFWAFGSDKFTALRNIIKEWGPITELDLMCTCTDAQFQKLTIQPGKTCHYSTDTAFKEACDKKIKEESYPLDKFLCREVPILELCEAFGLDGSYVPQSMVAQMEKGEIAQDRATTSPPTNPQPPVQPPPAQPPLPTEGTQPAQPAQPVQPTAPPPPAENFASLDEIKNLL